jgi:hypothetical protein
MYTFLRGFATPLIVAIIVIFVLTLDVFVFTETLFSLIPIYNLKSFSTHKNLGVKDNKSDSYKILSAGIKPFVGFLALDEGLTIYAEL